MSFLTNKPLFAISLFIQRYLRHVIFSEAERTRTAESPKSGGSPTGTRHISPCCWGLHGWTCERRQGCDSYAFILRHWSRVGTRKGARHRVRPARSISSFLSFLVSKSLLNFLVSYISSFQHFYIFSFIFL